MKLHYVTDQHPPYFMEIIPPWDKDLIYIIGEAAGGGDMTEFEILRNRNQWQKGQTAMTVRRMDGESTVEHWSRTVLEAHRIVCDDWLNHQRQDRRNKQLRVYVESLDSLIENLQRYRDGDIGIPEGEVTDEDLEGIKRAMNSFAEGENLFDEIDSRHGG